MQPALDVVAKSGTLCLYARTRLQRQGCGGGASLRTLSHCEPPLAGEDVARGMLFLPYAAPEVVMSWRDGGDSFVADPATDVWSLGVIFYELLTQQRYFLDATDERHVAAMLLGEQPLPHEQPAAVARNSSLGVLRRHVPAALLR